MGGAATWFAAFGLQGVIFSWLVTFRLGADPAWVGIAQASGMAPAILFILIGGAFADRRDRRAIVVTCHLLGASLASGLVALLAADQLSLGLLIGFAFCIGTVQAFVTPARDSLLSEVGAGRVGRAVLMLQLTQQIAQLVGTGLGWCARFTGAAPMIAVQALMLVGGAGALARVPAAPPSVVVARPGARQLLDAVRTVVSSPDLRPIFMLTIAVGALFMGPFMVVFPLMIREYYQGDLGELTLLSLTMPIGVLGGTAGLMAIGMPRRRTVGMHLALVGGCGCLLSISSGLPFAAMLCATLAFGSCGAVFMSLSRTEFQERAPTEQRATVLATYSLGMMGAGALIGAPLSGVLIENIGLRPSLIANAVAMLTVVAWAALTARRSPSAAA
jgi:MFS family permease